MRNSNFGFDEDTVRFKKPVWCSDLKFASAPAARDRANFKSTTPGGGWIRSPAAPAGFLR